MWRALHIKYGGNNRRPANNFTHPLINPHLVIRSINHQSFCSFSSLSLTITRIVFIHLSSMFYSLTPHSHDPIHSICLTAFSHLWSCSLAKVHVYFLRDNTTDSVANVNAAKYYVDSSTALSFFTSDPNGSPSSALSGE